VALLTARVVSDLAQLSLEQGKRWSRRARETHP